MAAKWVGTISPEGVIGYKEEAARGIWDQGNAVFMRNWPYAWSELQKENSAVKGKVGVTTMVSLKNENPISTLGSWGFSILESSKHKEEAYKAIKYLTSNQSQKILFLKYGYTPTKVSLFKVLLFYRVW